MREAKYKPLLNFFTHLGLCMTTTNSFLITTMQYIPV